MGGAHKGRRRTTKGTKAKRETSERGPEKRETRDGPEVQRTVKVHRTYPEGGYGNLPYEGDAREVQRTLKVHRTYPAGGYGNPPYKGAPGRCCTSVGARSG